MRRGRWRAVMLWLASLAILAVAGCGSEYQGPHDAYSRNRSQQAAAAKALRTQAVQMEMAISASTPPALDSTDYCSSQPARLLGESDTVTCSTGLQLIYTERAEGRSADQLWLAEKTEVQTFIANLRQAGWAVSSEDAGTLNDSLNDSSYDPYPIGLSKHGNHPMDASLDLVDRTSHKGVDDPLLARLSPDDTSDFVVAIGLSTVYVGHASCNGCYKHGQQEWPTPHPS